MFTYAFDIEKESKTKYLAEALSKICVQGDILGFSGNMGSGKTTFIRYFISKITGIKKVPSPTYNLMLPYITNKSIIYHMDVWRIKDSNEVLSLGIDEMFEKSIFLIEWVEKIIDILPNNILRLSIYNKHNNRIIKLKGNKTWEKKLKKLIDNEKLQTIS